MLLVPKAKIGLRSFKSSPFQAGAPCPARAASRVKTSSTLSSTKGSKGRPCTVRSNQGRLGPVTGVVSGEKRWKKVTVQWGFPMVKVRISTSKVQQRWHSSEWRVVFLRLGGEPLAFAAASNLDAPKWQMSQLTNPRLVKNQGVPFSSLQFWF